MKKLWLLTAFASLPMLCHAEAAPASTSSENSCRKIISTKDPAGTVYCGNAAQWAELDRRISLMKAGVTCQVVASGKELCLNDADWKQYNRMVRSVSLAARMGSSMQEVRGASIGDIYAGAAREQMDANLQSFQQSMVPQVPAQK